MITKDTLPYLTLPYLTLPYLTLPYLTLHITLHIRLCNDNQRYHPNPLALLAKIGCNSLLHQTLKIQLHDSKRIDKELF